MENGRDALKLAECLCEEDPAAFQWQHFRQSEASANLEKLLSLGILQHTSNGSSIWCTNCESPHSVPVEFSGDGACRAYCQEIGFFDVEAADLRVLELIWRH